MKNYYSCFSLLLVFLLAGFTSCGSGNGNKKKESSETEAQTEAAAEASVAEHDISGSELISQLCDAAFEGDMEKVEEALESGVKVNGRDQDGRTALMFASFNGFSEIVLLLLDEGADISLCDGMGRTALLYAATGPFPETVRILLDKGAEPNVVDSNEHFTPLMHAAAEGNLDVVKILLKAGSDLSMKDVDGDNAASFARQAGHLEVAKYLESL